MNTVSAQGQRLQLQVRTSGGWKTVIRFTEGRLDEVKRAVDNLAGILGASAAWCVRDESGHRELLPLPAACRECGCTELNACEGGCWWVEPGLCSACAPAKSRNHA